MMTDGKMSWTDDELRYSAKEMLKATGPTGGIVDKLSLTCDSEVDVTSWCA